MADEAEVGAVMIRQSAALAALLLAGCSTTISEDTLLRPTLGGALNPQALGQAAPAYASSEHWITAADGTRLHAVLLRQPGSRATILYFGGNGYTIGQFGAMTARQFAPIGADLMIVDHRGYGRSEGRPSQANLEADGVAAFDYLTRTAGVAPEKVVIHGQSLGSFIAGRVAVDRSAGGVVLESSATTTEDWVAASHRGIARMLVRVDIDPTLRGRGNLPNMPRIEEPLLILVGSADRTTPPRLSQALYNASPLPPGRKSLAIIPGANHVDVMDRPQTIAAYRAFVERLGISPR
ncbi:MAG TPA: alpha/beta hydrolase [Allosphingosinicella sp.]|nr:alpha/beta hydrolase [Allosphingosinicella sp.]